MSDYKFDTDYLEVGDIFEGGPIEQSYFISAVMAVGGEFQIDGYKVTILKLPKSNKVADLIVETAPKEEDSKEVVLKVEEPKVEEPKVDPEIAISPAPKLDIKSGPKPKTTQAVRKPKE